MISNQCTTCFCHSKPRRTLETDRAADEASTYLLELGRLAGGRAYLAKGPQRPLVLFPGNAEQAQRGSLGLQGRHHLSKSATEEEITGLLARHLSDKNPFRRSGSHGSTALCALPCLAPRVLFKLFFIPPPKYGGVPFMIGALFCNVRHYETKTKCRPTSDIRHVRHAMIAPLLLWLSKIEGARPHAA